MTRLVALTDCAYDSVRAIAFFKHVIIKQGCGLDIGDVTIDPPNLEAYEGIPVITLGKKAMANFMEGAEDRVSEFHGHIHSVDGLRLVAHTFGLDACIKQPNFVPLVVGEIRNLLDASRQPEKIKRPAVLTGGIPDSTPAAALVDLEWDYKNRVTAVGFGTASGTYSTADVHPALKMITRMLEEGRQVIGHNLLQADMQHISGKPKSYGPQHIFDTKIGAHLVHPQWAGMGLYDLGSLVRYHFPTEDWKHDTADTLFYNGLDCAYNWNLAQVLLAELKETNQTHLIEHEQELHVMTLEMRRKGVKIDRPAVAEAITTKQAHKDALKENLPINPNSPKQIIAWLKTMGIYAKDTKAETLGKLRGRNKQIDNLIDFRVDSKNITTWFDPEAEFMYPKFDVCGTNVARLSSSDPNYQNIPDALRRYIVPRHESLEFFSMDASQGENRWVAFYAEDDAMLAGFDAGGDNHQRIADNISKAVGYTVTRDFGKTVVHASNYGEKEFNLSERLFGDRKGPHVQMAKRLQEGYFAAYPKTREWQKRITVQMDRGDTRLRSAYGRERTIFAMDSHERMKRALHFMGCSSCADMVHYMWRKIKRELGLLPLLVVHDELLYEIPKGEQGEKLKWQIKELSGCLMPEQGNRPGAWGYKAGLNYGKKSETNPLGLSKV